MHVSRSMRSPSFPAALHVAKSLGALGLAFFASACGSGNDYYFLNDIKGQGDNVLFEFIFTCGAVTIDWDGSFGQLPHHTVNLSVKHDDQGNDCEEDPREIPFDAGPIKQSFRQEHPWPTPLGLRVPPYEEEQGAICLADLFQDAPFKGKRCK